MHGQVLSSEGNGSVLELLALLVRRWRVLFLCGLVGGFSAALVSLLTPRQFVSSAAFVPESSPSASAGLAAAARQFGIGVADGAGAAWTSALYVQVLSSDALLVALAGDSVSVIEEGGRRAALVDLFDVPEGTASWRQEKLLKTLRREVVSVSESRLVGSVTITVSSEWASVSRQIVDNLVRRVDSLNQMSKRAQASAELQFLESRLAEARGLLAESEGRLLRFLEANRVSNDPNLQFKRDALERDLRFQEQLILTLAQQREEARLRRFRDVPSITVIESPRVPEIGRPRGTILRAALGCAAGFAAGTALVLLFASLSRAVGSDKRGRDALISAVSDAGAPGIRNLIARLGGDS